jgi:hypothetical protein
MLLVVGDKVDVALTPQVDVLGLVPGHEREAHHLEHGFEHTALERGKLHELETVEAHGVVEKIGHCLSPYCRHSHARVVLPVLSCPRCLARIVGRRRCHRRVHRARPRAGKARGATVQGRGAQSLSKYAGQISSICCALWANKAGFNQLYANLR